MPDASPSVMPGRAVGRLVVVVDDAREVALVERVADAAMNFSVEPNMVSA
jgi:hypothetical protein